MRLIDADALDTAFTMMRFNDLGEIQHWGDRKDWCLSGHEIEKLIADAPTIEAEPVRRGRWMWDDEGYHCSECFFHAYGNTLECMDGTYKHCPNCGARMEEEK